MIRVKIFSQFERHCLDFFKRFGREADELVSKELKRGSRHCPYRSRSGKCTYLENEK